MLKYFDRYIIKELMPPFLVGFLVYTFVLVMNQLFFLADLLISKGVSLDVGLRLITYLLPSLMVFSLPMSVLMGVLAGLSRLSSDQEMTAFKTLGVGPARLIKPIFIFALGGWLVSSALTLFVMPRANYQWLQTLARSVVSKVQFKFNPREFNESIPRTVLFVQDIKAQGEWKNLFIFQEGATPSEPNQIILARRGRINFYPEIRRAIFELYDGAIHPINPAKPEEYSPTLFNSLEREIDVESLFAEISKEKRSVREKDYRELIGGIRTLKSARAEYLMDKKDLGAAADEKAKARRAEIEGLLGEKNRDLRAHYVELQKRFALPFVCLIFVFLGIPLGVSTKKGGRTSGFTISLGIILVYYLLITAGEKMALDGKISPFLGMWGPDMILLAAGLWLFAFSVRDTRVFSKIGFWLKRGEIRSAQGTSSQAESFRSRRRFSPRFPNILDRYIIRKYLVIFLMIFLALLSVSVVVAFFEGLDNIYEHKKPFALLLQYSQYRIPEFVSYILPVAALTTTLLVLGLLTKFNEITAMKACGISVYRIILATIVLGSMVSVVSFYNQERVLPYAKKKAEEIWNRINDRPVQNTSYLDRQWVLGRNKDRIFHYVYFDPASDVFSRLFICDMDISSWELKRIIYTDKARLNQNTLQLEKFWSREVNPGGSVSPFRKGAAMDLAVVERADYFAKESKAADQMNYGELKTYTAEIEQMGFDTTQFKVKMMSKLSFPLVCLIMTILGIPFAFSMGKRGALVGIGLSISVAIVFWAALALFESLGKVKILTPFLAAWAPNLIFGLLGIYLLFKLKT